MTLFEKIYFTVLIINFIVCWVDIVTESIYDLWELFVGQIILTILYEVVRLILFIWGVSVDLFPSVYFISN